MSTSLTAVALVATGSPERYARQLASHLGRKAEVHEEADGVRLLLAGGECLLSPASAALELRATAADAETLDRVTQVVGAHLERFGRRHELEVTWQRD
ncbi:MAG: DUF2218 domain-containing protein [Frankiales bacterium]|nr:DUF2218 domain-containing protein [Frankiales bacterium]